MKELAFGAMIALYMVSGTFFLRFWKRTRETLFLYFALAFGVLAVQCLALAVTHESGDESTWLYALRLLAFIFILIGIWQKNRAGQSH